MILLSRHGLTPVRKVPMESMQLNLTERDSSASFTPVDMDGISLDNWMLDDDGPGAGTVYRVKSITKNYGTRTPRVMLEHTIKQLGDRLIFGERGPAEIVEEATGQTGATTCTAKQAIEYVLNRQSDWVLGDFDYNNVSGAYKFNGETILECVEKVCNTLQDCWWSYDFSSYPFTLNITQKSNTLGTVLRANRNLAGVQKTIDRSGMVTRFYPIGKNDLHITGSYVDKNVDTYGVASRVETDESLETEAELTAWANEYLDRHAEPIITINVDALELAEATGETLDTLQLGKKCRIMMEEFGEEITETIVSISYNDKVKQPEVAKVTLANNRQDATKLIAEAVKQTRRSSRSTAYNNRKVCVGAVVVGNTLTLTFGDGSTVNFSKGGSGSVVMGWGTSPTSAPSSNQNSVNAQIGSDQSTRVSKTLKLDASEAWSSGAKNVYLYTGDTATDRLAVIQATSDATASKIKSGQSVCGVSGSYDPTVVLEFGTAPAATVSGSSNSANAKRNDNAHPVSKKLQLNAAEAWSNGTKNVYLYTDDDVDNKKLAVIQATSDAVASKIKNGETICGVTGSYALTNEIDMYQWGWQSDSEPSTASWNSLPSKTGVDKPLGITKSNAWYKLAIDVNSSGGVVRKWYKVQIKVNDSNLKASNIKNNVTILGITGSYTGSGGSSTSSALSIVSSSSGTSMGTISATTINNSRGSYLQWTVGSTTYCQLIQ